MYAWYDTENQAHRLAEAGLYKLTKSLDTGVKKARYFDSWDEETDHKTS
jgi:hypothetical protein